ncbi:hypothetical protein NBRC110019_13320 [Neptunitalea chrysea]|uniref:Uncharacterized protein n=1 Tax=Neptunitalea chrysea TaxID=1647581 RepID=A0A9W6B450_9FLAO|nr:hypothetical protein [Neptunitalea chrysea]GLB52293.1 hypothetical protein NBRC110019_13320 [Neptunitalea chrysea]
MENKNSHIKKEGFKIPENYFENFEERLMHTIANEKVPDFPKETGFKIPDTYFEDVEIDILAKISSENVKPIRKISWVKRFNYIAGSVAAIIIVALGINSIFNGNNEINTLTATDIENSIEAGYLPISSYDVGEAFSDDIATITMTNSNELSEDDIINYLSVYNITQEEE